MFGKVSSGDSNAGVSPVIGVILMVAITVILAAVIGTFVLDLAGDLDEDAQASVTFDEDIGDSVDVQLITVQTADSLWVESDSGTYNDGGVDDEDIGSSDEFGPGEDGNQYLLTRDDAGGAGTVVSVDTDVTEDGQISVIGEVEGNTTVVQTYEYSGTDDGGE